MKHPFVLTRQSVSQNHTYGVLEAKLRDGRSMKLRTKEGRHLRLGNPVNPAYRYCLPEGTYSFLWKPLGMYPFVPHLRTRTPQPKSRFADDTAQNGSGNICIGTCLDDMNCLTGFDEAIALLNELMRENYDDWKVEPTIIIRSEIDFDHLIEEKETVRKVNFIEEDCETIIAD